MPNQSIQVQVHTFTTTFPGLVNTLKTEIRVSHPIQNGVPIVEPGADPNAFYPGKAIWDTGATNTTITKRLAQALNLKPLTKTKIKGVNSESWENVYLVSIMLPNKVIFPMTHVTECEALSHPDDPEQCDVLIGMDIIANGDFAVTNFNGQTTMSFRLPSVQRIDFNVIPEQPTQIKKPLIKPSLSGPPPNRYTQGKGKKR